MNFSQQKKSFLITKLDADDISALGEKKEATILVVSDSHGRKEKFRNAIMEEGKNCDALVFCGDGTDDLMAIFEESVYDEALFEAIPKVIAVARGNGDWNTAYAILSKSGEQTAFIVPPQSAFKIAKKNIFVTHGHLFDVRFETTVLEDAAAHTNKADIIFYGHTHRRDFHENKGVYLVNPGSPAHPRDGLQPSYALVKISGNNITCQFVESLDYL